MKTVSILGSTGSIGTQAVDVIKANPDKFKVMAISGHKSFETLLEQVEVLRPEVVVVSDETKVSQFTSYIGDAGITVLTGAQGLIEAATMADIVLNAVVGFAGLGVTISALQSGKRLALANKESLIAGAPVVRKARKTPGAEIIPVDSEHCALHQCLRASFGIEEVKKLLLTASGGPFREYTFNELKNVTVENALDHPTWRMGAKVTVDSSTLMNKGLEVIEAYELFGVDYGNIEVIVHPESLVHSMVEFADGAVMAQLSKPDMRLCIGYGLGYPKRLPHAFGVIDWTKPLGLNFYPPDTKRFKCLQLAYSAGKQGGSAPCALNAANEVAVEAFIGGEIPWLKISEVVAETLEHHHPLKLDTFEAVLEADREARFTAKKIIMQL